MASRAYLRACLALSLLLATSCSDDERDDASSDGAVVTPDSGSVMADAGIDGGFDGGLDAGGDASAPDAGAILKACLERPDQLPMPPTGELPCELLPPGFSR